MKKEFLECGQIVSTHGIKGEVKINHWCDDPSDLVNVKKLYFDGGQTEIKVEKIRPKGNQLITKLEGINNPDEAQKLRGRIVFARRDDLDLEDGEYFIAEMIGMKVIDADTKEEYGTLTDVSSTGANDVYHITFKDGKERLIPAIPQVIIDTDIDSDILKIRPLEGLFDDDED